VEEANEDPEFGRFYRQNPPTTAGDTDLMTAEIAGKIPELF